MATAYHIVNPSFAEADITEYLSKEGKSVVSGLVKLISIDVIHQITNQRQEEIRPGTNYSMYAGQLVFAAEVSRVDEKRDIAIIRCPKALLKAAHPLGPLIVSPMQVPSLDGNVTKEGVSVSATGFPAIEGEPTGVPGLTTNFGKISNAYYKLPGVNGTYYLADLHINKGDSGAPVYKSADGQLLVYL